jgi:hypothetical protein
MLLLISSDQNDSHPRQRSRILCSKMILFASNLMQVDKSSEFIGEVSL